MKIPSDIKKNHILAIRKGIYLNCNEKYILNQQSFTRGKMNIDKI